MSYHTECDWCGAWLRVDDDQAAMKVTIHHRRGKSALDAKWAEETKQARHFCASPKEDTDPGGRTRAGLVPEQEFDSCFDRAIAAMTRTELADPGMGMEWRLMPVDTPKPDKEVRSAPKAPPASPKPEASVASSSAPPSKAQPSQRERGHEEWEELVLRHQMWRNMPWGQREAHVLEALGEDQLTAADLAAKLNARFGWPTDWREAANQWRETTPLDRPPIASEDARSVVMRLLARGAVDRVIAPSRNRPAVWHFFQTAAAEPSIDERKVA